jgi:undecaprenyl-phosphate galactose phosphotransferase
MYSFRTILIWEELKKQLQVHMEYLSIMLVNDIAFWGQRYIIVHLIVGITFTFFNLFILGITRKIFKNELKKNLIIIGIGNTAKELTDIIRKNLFPMYNLLGYVSVNDICGIEQISHINKTMILGTYSDLDRIIDENNIKEIIIAVPLADNQQMNNIINKVDGKVNRIKFIPEFNGMFTFNSQVENYDGLMLISAKINFIKGIGLVIKRLFDLFISITAIFLIIPIMLFVWAKTDKEERKYGLFFFQERIGKNGEKIVIYKFRSMVSNADEILEEMIRTNKNIKEEYEKNKKIKNDPRVTKIGKFLRRTSLDEFPQFINVFKGEMSFIGPRPYLPKEKSDMREYYEKIIKSKPGITGMWQTHGRSEIGFEERLVLDEYYYRNWSLWLDMIIFVKTIENVISRKGAY